jgi:YD repeat-containing protein
MPRSTGQIPAFFGGQLHLWTNYHYDTLGRLEQVTDANGNVTSAAFDSLGRMTALHNGDAGLTEWRYTIGGDLRAKITPNLRPLNQFILYTREHHRLMRVDYPNANIAPTIFTYGTNNLFLAADNSSGRLIRRDDASGYETFSYGELGEVVETNRVLNGIGAVGALSATTQFTYDSFNRIRSIRYPDQELVTYEYDNGGALRHVAGTTPSGGVNEYVKDIHYDVFGHRVFQRLGNNVATHYQYDPVMQRLQGVNTDSVNQGPLQRLTYSYTAVGNIAGVSTVRPRRWAS